MGLWSTIDMPVGAENIGKRVTAKFDAFDSINDDATHVPESPRHISTRTTWHSESARAAVLRKQRAAADSESALPLRKRCALSCYG